MSACLGSLPPELYTAIISHLPANSLQQTVLALTRALPFSPIPRYHLYTHICLKHGSQVIQLYHVLKKSLDHAAWVKEFALKTWQVDADVVVNLIHLLSQSVTILTLFLGPNFAPEHLEEIFEKPMSKLCFLVLRFRPYVQRATYYQFLKRFQGAYFDSTMQALSQWPCSPTQPLLSLSIVQDPIPEDVQKQQFAQPLVFFRLDPLTTLVCSEYLRSLTYFRLRIPARDYVRFIYTCPNSLPALELLDISTSSMLHEVEPLLVRLPKLRHLIFDKCSTNILDINWWTLGNLCSLAGVKRAKERRRDFKVWFEANARLAVTDQEQSPTDNVELIRQDDPKRPRRGRRGLATATISLKKNSARNINLLALKSSLPTNISTPDIHILPPLPPLTSLSITIPPQTSNDKRAKLCADFERGWTQGLAQLLAVRNRRRQSQQNGTRVLRFSDGPNVSEEGLHGLVDIRSDDADFELDPKAPILCLAGPGHNADHVDGCGHQVSWEVWKDDSDMPG